MNTIPLRVFILAKNENANIQRCLESLHNLGAEVLVLDSGSTDGTQEIAAKYAYAKVENYTYINHCKAYNEICTERIEPNSYALILDADMVLTSELVQEIRDLIVKGNFQVAQAPVLMWWIGQPLKHGSLYPPKPFLFKAGVDYFVPVGHGEMLRNDVKPIATKNGLIHDDRKPYVTYLLSQSRYVENFLARSSGGHLSWRDRLRLSTPLMIFIVPIVSFICRLGFLSGITGAVYALDRLIAEAIFYRQILASRTRKPLRDGVEKD